MCACSFQLTSLVTSLMTQLRVRITDAHFLQQLVRVGVLVEFESLLSCHDTELCMLEDFVVAVADLRHVTFKVMMVESSDVITPKIEGNR